MKMKSVVDITIFDALYFNHNHTHYTTYSHSECTMSVNQLVIVQCSFDIKLCPMQKCFDILCTYAVTSGSAARHPSLYLALRARPWIRISQSYDVDMSDVDTTLMLFAAVTASRTTESWQ